MKLERHLTIVGLLGTVLLTLPAAAQFTCRFADGNAILTSYDGPGGPVVTPTSVQGRPVTRIDSEAFYFCTNVTEVTISEGVTSIGHFAFVHCRRLCRINLPSTVQSIGDYAFLDCGLTNIEIPAALTNIGHKALTAPGLLEIAVDPLNPVYRSGEGCLYLKRTNWLVQFPLGCGGAWTIPEGVAGIGDCAFWMGVHLTSVNVPASVTRIGKHAFQNCTNLTGVYFCGPKPVLSPARLGPFDGNNRLTVYYPAGVANWGPDFGGWPTALWTPVHGSPTTPAN